MTILRTPAIIHRVVKIIVSLLDQSENTDWSDGSLCNACKSKVNIVTLSLKTRAKRFGYEFLTVSQRHGTTISTHDGRFFNFPRC